MKITLRNCKGDETTKRNPSIVKGARYVRKTGRGEVVRPLPKFEGISVKLGFNPGHPTSVPWLWKQLGGRERCYLGAGASAVAKKGVERTGGGCVNNSAAIKYSGTSCGWTRINSLGRLFPSGSFLNLLFIHANKALSPTQETRKRVTLKANVSQRVVAATDSVTYPSST